MHTKLRTLKLFRQKRRIVIGRRKKELEIERELKTMVVVAVIVKQNKIKILRYIFHVNIIMINW